jgi:hypothetical protein
VSGEINFNFGQSVSFLSKSGVKISQFVSLSHEKRQLGYVFESRENPRNMYTKNAGKCPATVHWYEA